MAKARKPKFRVGQKAIVVANGLHIVISHRQWQKWNAQYVYWAGNSSLGWTEKELRPLTKREIGPRSPSASKEE